MGATCSGAHTTVPSVVSVDKTIGSNGSVLQATAVKNIAKEISQNTIVLEKVLKIYWHEHPLEK